MEPLNSWEVSYIISIRKPHVELNIAREELVRAIGGVRASELAEWAEENFTHRWFLEHI